MTSHPGELALRRHRIGETAGEERAALAAHLEACATCRARLADLDREAAAFEAAVPFERFAAGVSRAARRPGRERAVPRRVRAWAPLGGLAAAAAVVVFALLLPGDPGPAGGNRIKGGAAVDFYVGGAGATRVAASHELLAAGERVRIAYRAGPWAYVTVVSVDAQGEVSPLYPTEGESLPAADPERTELLPESVAFLGHGLERVIVLLTAEPLDVDTVVGRARDAWTRAGGDVDRLPPLGFEGEQIDRVFLKP